MSKAVRAMERVVLAVGESGVWGACAQEVGQMGGQAVTLSWLAALG